MDGSDPPPEACRPLRHKMKAVLFTGRCPAGLRRFVVGTHLVSLRYGAY